MHSVSESSDGTGPEPLHVVCHIATLIVEGRLPQHRLQSSADPNDLKVRKPKPYHEGLHCPTMVGGIPKQGNHRCSEQSTLCIRHGNLRHQLELLGTSVVLEVYLAPNCYCAQLRSESTLVSTPASADDVLLEQWDLNVYNKRSQESPTALANLYQAVRSSLHFSQLAAWYVTSDGRQPAHVVYRVCALRDAAQPLGSMGHHRFPIADIDKNTSIMLSVISLPRIETIPPLQCSVHTNDGTSQSGLVDKFRSHSFPSPLRFSFERTACNDVKRKSNSRTFVGSEFDEPDILDGLVVHGVSSKLAKDYSSVIKPTSLTVGVHLVEHLSAEAVSKKKLMEKIKLGCGKSDEHDLVGEKSKEAVTNLVDDRMHISCRVAGKHHCENSLEEDQEQASEKDEEQRTKRRRSVSRARARENADSSDFSKLGYRDSERVLHGKFKDMYQDRDSNSANGFGTPQIQYMRLPASAPALEAKTTSGSSVVKNSSCVKDDEKLNCLEVRNTEYVCEKADNPSANPFLAAILRSAEKTLPVALQLQRTNVSDVSTNTDMSFGKFPPDAKFVLRKVSKPNPTQSPLRILCDINHSTPLQKMSRSSSTGSGSARLGPEQSSSSTLSDDIFPLNRSRGYWDLSEVGHARPVPDISNLDSSEDERDLTIVGRSESYVSDISGSESSGTSATRSFRSLFSGPPLFSQPLLGSFEESALQGRLTPVSTVFGFTAELGASGSFLPPHIQLPVTVSYLSNRQDGAGALPYLGHVNLHGKGYHVPRAGTIQMTLFNPQSTVVHIFVVQYYLEDMPPNSCTFLRQRTLRVPVTFDEIITDWDAGHGSNFSKFIIHLRFCSGRTGNIYLTPDIKFLIFNRADADTASVIQRRGEEAEPVYKVLTKIITPQDPKYSPKP